MTNNLKAILSLVFATTVLSGCVKDFNIASHDADFLAPLAFGSISINDYDGSDRFQIDGNDTLRLVIDDTIFSIGLEDLIDIPDTSVLQEYSIPFNGLTIPPGVPFYGDTSKTTYRLNSIKLKYAFLREATIKLQFSNTINKPVVFSYTILSATKNGQPYEIAETVPGNTTFTKTISLAGYDLDLRGPRGNLSNTITAIYTVMIDPNETQSHTFSLGDKFSLETTFKSIIPEYLTGFFGSDIVDFKETVDFAFFDNYPFSYLDIQEFDLRLKVDNGIGADLSLDVKSIDAYNQSTSQSVALNHSLVGSAVGLNRAVQLYQNNGVKHQQVEFQFSNTNSNLDELLEIAPSGFDLDLGVSLNPFGNISLGNDFAFYDHNLSMILSGEVPLNFGLGRLHLKDSVDYSFEIADEDTSLVNRINSAQIKVQLSNGYPMASEIQIYVLNEGLSVVDSLFIERQMVAGLTSDLVASDTNFSISTIVLPLDQNKIDRLESGKIFLLDVFLSTTDQQVIYLSSNSKISYKIAIELNTTIP